MALLGVGNIRKQPVAWHSENPSFLRYDERLSFSLRVFLLMQINDWIIWRQASIFHHVPTV